MSSADAEGAAAMAGVIDLSGGRIVRSLSAGLAVVSLLADGVDARLVLGEGER
jgi:hypothetical protein